MSPTGIVGIEPTTPRLTVVCYYHLSYIPRTGIRGIEPLRSVLETDVLPLNYIPMQSGGSLDGCHYRTDATCKTVANKGISFFNVVLGPCTPPHGSHNPPTTSQRTSDESSSLSSYLGCTLLSQFSASTCPLRRLNRCTSHAL